MVKVTNPGINKEVSGRATVPPQKKTSLLPESTMAFLELTDAARLTIVCLHRAPGETQSCVHQPTPAF